MWYTESKTHFQQFSSRGIGLDDGSPAIQSYPKVIIFIDGHAIGITGDFAGEEIHIEGGAVFLGEDAQVVVVDEFHDLPGGGVDVVELVVGLIPRQAVAVAHRRLHDGGAVQVLLGDFVEAGLVHVELSQGRFVANCSWIIQKKKVRGLFERN